MKKELAAFIDSVKSDQKILSYDEKRTKQAVVLKAIHTLGWDTFNMDEVFTDFSAGEETGDYILKTGSENKVFIKVKEPKADLKEFENSFLADARRVSAEIGVLTNGLEWWFYLPLREDDERAKFHNLEIFNQDTADLTDRFITFLSRDKVAKGKSLMEADKVFRSRKKKRLIRDALAEVWQNVTQEEDNEIIRFLAAEAEKISGYPPELSDVVVFLRSIQKKRRGRKAAAKVEEKKPKVRGRKKGSGRKKTKTASQKEESADNKRGAFIGKKPRMFTFLGRPNKVTKWKEVLTKVCNILSKSQEEEFGKVLEIRGRKRLYFSNDPQDLKEPRLVNGTEIYVETNFNASNLYTITLKVLQAFGYGENDLVIETK